MKHFFSTFFLLSLIMQTAFAQVGDSRNYRTLYIFSPDQRNDLYYQLNRRLQSESEEVVERDLVVYRLFPEEGIDPEDGNITSNEVLALREKFKVAPGDFAVILVGKDGYRKMRWDNKVKPLQVVFDKIDAMPMRRREMRERGMDDDGKK
ncbi:DUF4174 domain-containing protein [Roseivirga sp. BDSF3-8]|uniref:DUF4174 domain-containing protein n=1 Tax=Roseivirga sp. BDSF3-8 TaxID=3241598 RepID=UPI003531980F